ncbi:hypothetical protein EVA_19074 [gut metagenome]|uniref:Uncharacterized protein n=1 Tax=gut metagenome TaxID=749906 RepID=J9FEH9_9ZZZZ
MTSMPSPPLPVAVLADDIEAFVGNEEIFCSIAELRTVGFEISAVGHDVVRTDKGKRSVTSGHISLIEHESSVSVFTIHLDGDGACCLYSVYIGYGQAELVFAHFLASEAIGGEVAYFFSVHYPRVEAGLVVCDMGANLQSVFLSHFQYLIVGNTVHSDFYGWSRKFVIATRSEGESHDEQ